MSLGPEQLIETRKLEILFTQSRSGLVASSILTVAVFGFLWSQDLKPVHFTWGGIYLLVCALRLYIIRYTSTADYKLPDLNRARRYYAACTLVAGLSWGLFCIIMLRENIHFGLFTIILILSMTAASANVYALYPSLYALFSFPALLAPAAWLLASGESTHDLYVFLILLFLALLTMSTVTIRKLILQSIGVQFENLRLLDDIESEKTQVSALNQQLQADLDELRKRDLQLSEEKDKAEKLAEKLMILSTRDGLTGIANRRYFDEHLAREWNRAMRAQSPISLILCDIDYFKNYNDHYGHQKGDRCLQQVASILEEFSRREGDIVARYGGEEFAIVLPDTGLDSARGVADKINAALGEAAIPHEASAVSNVVTISMGVSSIQPARGIYSASLIAETDRMLYQAKSSGRNRVVAGPCTACADTGMTPRKEAGVALV